MVPQIISAPVFATLHPVSDLEFFFDPVCPWAWITSRWIHEVAAEREMHVHWRFLSLHVLNEGTDYAEFPPNHLEEHTTGLKLLRVAASVRDTEGAGAIEDLYTTFGTDLHVKGRSEELWLELNEGLPRYLDEIAVGARHAAAANDPGWDSVIRAETAEALQRAGPDLGTPVITLDPPYGPSFFGPVISRIPRGAEALRTWDAFEVLARTPGMAEIKRSLRDRPDFT